MSYAAANTIAHYGWEQGSVLKPADVGGVVTEPALKLGPDDVLIVVSQTCDLVHPSFVGEPFVEVLKAAKVTESNGNLTFGKNPRRLQFEIAGVCYDASCHDRVRFKRELLVPLMPSLIHQLDQRTVRVIVEWISKRYTRPAFPDEFNRRIDPKRSRLRDVLKRHAGPIDEILINLTPDGEVKPNIRYKLTVWLVMRECDYENTEKKAQAEAAVVPLETHLNSCDGIEVTECKVLRESAITLDDLRFLVPWDFDDLTFRTPVGES